MNNDLPERRADPPERDIIVCPDCGSENIIDNPYGRDDYQCLDCLYTFDEDEQECDYGYDTLVERDL